MKIKTSILIKISVLLSLMILALSISFYFIYSNDIKARVKHQIEGTFTLFKDHINTQKETISNETNKINASLKNILDAIYVYEETLPQNSQASFEDFKNLIPLLSPAVDEIYKLAKSLDQERVQIAIYAKNGDLLFLYDVKNNFDLSVSFYYPKIDSKKLIVLREKKFITWTQQTKDFFHENDLLFLPDTDSIKMMEVPAHLALKIDPELINSNPYNSCKVVDDLPAFSYRTPIYGLQQTNTYFSPITNSSLVKEPNNGLIYISKQLGEGDLEKIAALTNTQINVFVNGAFSVGTLHTYRDITQDEPLTLPIDIVFSEPRISFIFKASINNNQYYEGRINPANEKKVQITIAVLVSRESEKKAILTFLYTMGVIIIIFGFIAMIIASRFSNTISKPISMAVDAMKRLSEGSATKLKLKTNKSDLLEIQQMKNALGKLAEVDLKISDLAESVAQGDLDIQITPRSEDDKILNSLNTMVKKIHEQRVQLENTNIELQNLATTDELTKLANRRYFNIALIEKFAIAKRNQTPISILMLDIDFFKKFNDFYGHQAGDDCLFQVAQVLKNNITRADDLIARYGGEEFIVITSQTKIQANKLAQKLCLSVESLNLEHQMSDHKKVTVSIGVATMTPEAQSKAESLVHEADDALYRAKELGRNRIE